MTKDILVEQRIKDKETNFNRYITTRSEAFSQSYLESFIPNQNSYKLSAIYGAIQLINLKGYERGIEIGVSFADSTITLLEYCEKLKTLYSVDKYESYIDYYTENFYVDEYEINIIKNLAFKRLAGCHSRHKLIFYEEDSDITVDRFQDKELDFVFLDAHLNAEHIKNDLEKWYPKVRSGGLVIIHDTQYPSVTKEIKNFIKNVNFSGEYSNVIDLCCLLKSEFD